MWGAIVGLITGVWNAIETVAITIVTIISTIWSIIRPILNPLWDAAAWSYRNVLKPMWSWISTHLDKLKQLYDEHVKPIIDRVYSIIATVKKIWHQILQPFFDFISALQQFLTITRLNQTVFGAWLDSELGQIYQFLNQLDARFMKPLNAILSVLNDIVLDIDGAFRYAITIRTTGKHIASISRQFWNVPLNLMQSTRLATGKLPHPKPVLFADTYAELSSHLTGGDTPIGDSIDHARAIFAAVIDGNHEETDAQLFSAFGQTIRNPSSLNT